MTKEEFYKQVNSGRYPKYVPSQIEEGKPEKDCSAIVCTASDRLLLAKYENGKWQQARFTHASDYTHQKIYYVDIEEDVIYWTNGEAKDKTRNQFSD